MKMLLALVISTLLPFLCSAADTNGFLVIEIGRDVYNTWQGGSTEPEVKQSFKIPLTPEILSNFKHLPNDNSAGSGFCCSSRFANLRDEAPPFAGGWKGHRTVAGGRTCGLTRGIQASRKR